MMLATQAAAVGADAAEARRALESGEGAAQIAAAQERLEALGVIGIRRISLHSYDT